MAMVEHGFQPPQNSPDFADMTKLGTGIYRSEDGGESWRFVNRYNNRPFYYSQIRINPSDDQLVYFLTTSFRWSRDGGKTITHRLLLLPGLQRCRHGDHHRGGDDHHPGPGTEMTHSS